MWETFTLDRRPPNPQKWADGPKSAPSCHCALLETPIEGGGRRRRKGFACLRVPILLPGDSNEITRCWVRVIRSKRVFPQTSWRNSNVWHFETYIGLLGWVASEAKNEAKLKSKTTSMTLAALYWWFFHLVTRNTHYKRRHRNSALFESIIGEWGRELSWWCLAGFWDGGKRRRTERDRERWLRSQTIRYHVACFLRKTFFFHRLKINN